MGVIHHADITKRVHTYTSPEDVHIIERKVLSIECYGSDTYMVSVQSNLARAGITLNGDQLHSLYEDLRKYIEHDFLKEN